MTNLKAVSKSKCISLFLDNKADADLTRRAIRILSRFFESDDIVEVVSLAMSQEDREKFLADITKSYDYKDYEIDGYFTLEEALKVIKSNYHKGLNYSVRANCFLYTEFTGEGVGRGYETSTLVSTSQKGAIRYVNDLFGSTFAEKGCMIAIRKSETILFVG